MEKLSPVRRGCTPRRRRHAATLLQLEVLLLVRHQQECTGAITYLTRVNLVDQLDNPEDLLDILLKVGNGDVHKIQLDKHEKHLEHTTRLTRRTVPTHVSTLIINTLGTRRKHDRGNQHGGHGRTPRRVTNNQDQPGRVARRRYGTTLDTADSAKRKSHETRGLSGNTHNRSQRGISLVITGNGRRRVQRRVRGHRLRRNSGRNRRRKEGVSNQGLRLLKRKMSLTVSGHTPSLSLDDQSAGTLGPVSSTVNGTHSNLERRHSNRSTRRSTTIPAGTGSTRRHRITVTLNGGQRTDGR